MSQTDSIQRQSVDRFLEMIKSSRRGKFKVYIGMAAGVGKTYRMLQEAHQLLKSGVDVCVGYVETHAREETDALVIGLPSIPRKSIFYKGRKLEELDIDSVLVRKPQVVLIDELAHTNVPGSRNTKRWEDVKEVLENGINVISTVNIQHIESIRSQVEKITGVEIKERVPDSIIHLADEVVNIDLTIDELIQRLKDGKIYDQNKVSLALNNFFQQDKLLQLRDLALKEVTRQVERKIDNEVLTPQKENAVLTCISSNFKSASNLIRKSSRLAAINNSKWYVLYIQTPEETPERINSSVQRHLLNNLKMATELNAEVVKEISADVAKSILEFAKKKEVGVIVIGKPYSSFFQQLFGKKIVGELIKQTEKLNIDILMVSYNEKT
ncbi:MAG: DEAD/DEAH box helicase family protein [Ignavibacteriales bacterium]|nr:DEAD/DEAH box helicase family protein [Ignavibacteriales bacterium]